MPDTNVTQPDAITAPLLQKDGISGSELSKELLQGRRRSMVRVVVTYAVTLVYLLTGAFMVLYLLRLEKFDLALGIFSSIAAASGTIIGFWFGTRGQGGSGEALVKPLAGLIERAGSQPQALAGAPIATPPSTKVMELQKLLEKYASFLPEGRIRTALDPGGVDGVMGEATIAAADNFLSLMDPPDRYEDLPEPRVDAVITILRREIAAHEATKQST